jgi:deoxyribonuclease-4
MNATGESCMNIGAHVSKAKGFVSVFDEITSIGGTCGQIFTHSPRTWRFKDIDEEEAASFKTLYQEKNVWPILIHESYVTNLAGPRQDIYEKSTETMRKEIEAASLLGIEYIVIHPGSHLGQGEKAGLDQIAHALSEYEPLMGDVVILLESTAGKGTDLGYTFQQLQHIREETTIETGVCLDTCHLFTAGYDIATADGLKSTLEELDAIMGLSTVKAVHLNDSKHPFKSHKDEHAHIGKGKIGEEGFRVLLSHPAIRSLPLILETPVDSQRGHRENIALVRKLASPVD